jgi:UDP-3-O-[3-hydroxymyristoyl] N-acetylglucosamine deacetylase / 3-hydroxyacyl-[acyl-carrier-protein] dehydratase
MKQKTLKSEITFSGIGLHTGAHANLCLKPAGEGHGFKFQRIDLPNAPVVAADVGRVVATTRGTVIQNGEAVVSTVEHLLSAFLGADLDNVLVEIDGPEVPIFDGSAKFFTEAIGQAGVLEQEASREVFEILSPISFIDEESGAEYIALPAEKFSITTLIDFDSEVLPPQFAQLESLEKYAHDIASARTFVFVHELEKLADLGLIKGGSIENAVVLAEKPISETELKRLSTKLGRGENIVISQQGVLSTTTLRFQNEPARHKLLDVIGDLALVGKYIKGRIVATKPGHLGNTNFAKLLKKHYLEYRKLAQVPRIDLTAQPVLDINQIAKKLPHRFPFLLVDKVMELSQTHIIGVKNVTLNEWFFQGHFPDNPVFPGVLQIEAMAQTGGILALANTPDDEIWDTYFLKIDNCKFRDKVVPGDTLVFKLNLLEPIRRGIVHMQATCFVGNKIASEAELTAVIQKRN